MPSPATFRERLTDLRDRAALNDYELSKLAGLSGSTAGHFLSGRRKDHLPAADTLLALSRLFGVSVDYLLTGGEAPRTADLHAAVDVARDARKAAEAASP